MHSTTVNDGEVETIIDASPLSAFQIRTIVLCGIIAAIDGFDTQAIAFVAPVIAKEWSANISEFGPVFGAGLFGLTIGALALGPAADRFGRKSVIVISTLLFAAGSLATVLSGTVTNLMLYRFVTGLGLGGVMPNIIALTAEYSPRRSRAFVVTSMFCGFPVGAVIGGLVCSKTIPLFGWESTFVVGGLLPLLLLPALIAWLPESIRFLVQRIGGREKALALLRRIDRSAALSPQAPAREAAARVQLDLFAIFADRRAAGTLFLWIAFFCNLLILYFLINWLPSALQRAGVSLENAIVATALLNAGGVAGGLTFSRLTDRFGPRRVLTFAYFGAAVFVGAIGIGWNSVLALYAVIGSAGFCVIGAQFGMNALAAEFYPTSLRSTGVGAALGVGRVGAIVGPLVGGALVSLNLGIHDLFLIAGAPAVFAGAAIFLACNNRISASGSNFASTQRPLANGNGQQI